jgi:hypothetical protein
MANKATHRQLRQLWKRGWNDAYYGHSDADGNRVPRSQDAYYLDGYRCGTASHARLVASLREEERVALADPWIEVAP